MAISIKPHQISISEGLGLGLGLGLVRTCTRTPIQMCTYVNLASNALYSHVYQCLTVRNIGKKKQKTTTKKMWEDHQAMR